MTVDGTRPPATPEASSTAAVGVVLSGDNRQRVPDTTAPPYCWVGQIRTDWPGGTSTGSGMLLGEQYVLTCAHNFINRADRTTARSVTFTLGLNRRADHSVVPGVPVRLDQFQAPQQYREAGGPPPPPGGIPSREVTNYLYDIAVARLAAPVPEPPGEAGFALGPIPANPVASQLVGYPGDLDPTATTQFRRQGASTLTDSEDLLTYAMSTYGGDSGAPVFYPDPSRPFYRVIGIHVSGVAGLENFAVPLTPTQVELVNALIEDLDNGHGTPLR